MTILIDELLKHDPAVHTELARGTKRTYGLHKAALRWLDANVQPDWRTLETGCGLSTAVFAVRSAEHTTISPFASESDRVREWCKEHDIPTAHVKFVDEHSEWVLPHMDLGALDLFLIDGAHAFPQVFIDWFYGAQALKIGGLLMIDDLPLWTGYVLNGFLRAEPGWTPVCSLGGRIALFRKTAPMDATRGFRAQPYVAKRSAVGDWRSYWLLIRRRQFQHLALLAGSTAKRRSRRIIRLLSQQ
jgi:Methyltransferase domain